MPKSVRCNVVFHGFRNEKLKNAIEAKGGSVKTKLSSNTCILVVKDDTVRHVIKEAKGRGLDVYTLEDFIATYLPKFEPDSSSSKRARIYYLEDDEPLSTISQVEKRLGTSLNHGDVVFQDGFRFANAKFVQQSIKQKYFIDNPDNGDGYLVVPRSVSSSIKNVIAFYRDIKHYGIQIIQLDNDSDVIKSIFKNKSEIAKNGVFDLIYDGNGGFNMLQITHKGQTHAFKKPFKQASIEAMFKDDMTELLLDVATGITIEQKGHSVLPIIQIIPTKDTLSRCLPSKKWSIQQNSDGTFIAKGPNSEVNALVLNLKSATICFK